MRDIFKAARADLEISPTNMILDLMTNIYTEKVLQMSQWL
jgi:hypothetical protein